MNLYKLRNLIHKFFYALRCKNAVFYRQYPFKSKIDIIQADARGIVDFDQNFFYNRIPKAANSTIVASIAENKYERHFSSEQDAKNIFTTTPAKLTRKQVALFNSLFKFTCVRNPYTRILSAYLDKIVHTKKLSNKLGDKPTFIDFLSFLKNEGLYYDAHWAPQHALLLLPASNFDYIAKVENIDTDLKYILRRIFSQPREIEHAIYNKHSQKSIDKISKYYSKKEQDLVYHLYKKDFDIFDYPHTLPRHRNKSND